MATILNSWVRNILIMLNMAEIPCHYLFEVRFSLRVDLVPYAFSLSAKSACGRLAIGEYRVYLRTVKSVITENSAVQL